MANVKHCTASPINDFEGFLHIFYCRIKIFTESLTEKLLHVVGWQGWVQNNRNSPDCRVLTQTYSTNFFSSRILASGGFLHCPLIICLKLCCISSIYRLIVSPNNRKLMHFNMAPEMFHPLYNNSGQRR